MHRTFSSTHLRKVNFDPLSSFDWLCYLVSSPGVIVVNSTSPYRTLSELIDGARARPGEVTLASVGPGTAQHIGFEMLRRAANINMAYVPYAGGAPAINALLGGHVISVFAEYAPWLGISRQERCAHWLRLRERGSSRSQICRRSRNPATPTTKWTCGGGSLHRQKRKRRRSNNWPSGLPKRCGHPRSRPSSMPKASRRWECAARILAHSLAGSSTITAVSFARPISRRSNAGTCASGGSRRSTLSPVLSIPTLSPRVKWHIHRRAVALPSHVQSAAIRPLLP